MKLEKEVKDKTGLTLWCARSRLPGGKFGNMKDHTGMYPIKRKYYRLQLKEMLKNNEVKI